MNFSVMPELNWKYGYLFSLLLILTSTVLIYLYLKKKGWTGRYAAGAEEEKENPKKADTVGCFIFCAADKE